MQELKFKVIEYIRMRGPVIPVQISKQIGSNILFAGAVLSELLASGKIKISTAKIGGSPVYYMPGQESRLTMLYNYLNQREKNAYDLLNKDKILRDRALQPVERVALREIKDFAYPLQVNDELFWRWYLVSEEEAKTLINPVIEKEQQVIEIPRVIQEQVQVKEEKLEIVEEIKPEVEIQERLQPEIKVEIKKDEKIKERKRIGKEAKKEDFILMLKNYFNNKRVKIVEENIVKKGKEFDYIVEIPSHVGDVRFFLSAKDKKKINDADLSLCHNKSQLKKLPLMILTKFLGNRFYKNRTHPQAFPIDQD